MSYDSTNVFARILRKELPCAKVYEDAHTLAFMDIMPSAEGHTLVIPREHAESIFDLSPEAASNLMVAAQKVNQLLAHAFQFLRRARAVDVLGEFARQVGMQIVEPLRAEDAGDDQSEADEHGRRQKLQSQGTSKHNTPRCNGREPVPRVRLVL